MNKCIAILSFLLFCHTLWVKGKHWNGFEKRFGGNSLSTHFESGYARIRWFWGMLTFVCSPVVQVRKILLLHFRPNCVSDQATISSKTFDCIRLRSLLKYELNRSSRLVLVASNASVCTGVICVHEKFSHSF